MMTRTTIAIAVALQLLAVPAMAQGTSGNESNAHTTKGDRKQSYPIRTSIPNRRMLRRKPRPLPANTITAAVRKPSRTTSAKRSGINRERPLPLILGLLIACRLDISPRRDEFGTTAHCDHLTMIVPVIPASR